MSTPLEDYALIGDTHTAALVSKNGSIDWLCLPRFDSGACFAALLGDESHGRWLLTPAGGVKEVRRHYRGDTLVLETEFHTEGGVVRILDCMPHREHRPDLLRILEGVEGRVPMRLQLIIRFDYGMTIPWVRELDQRFWAIAGPNALVLDTPVHLRGKGLTTVAEFEVAQGDRVPFVLSWYPSHEAPPAPRDAFEALSQTEETWTDWSARLKPTREWRDATIRSLVTLKALTYQPTGGIVAAPTTSLPEQLGGVRNWDYRYCWLRDATFTLYSLLVAGYKDEAKSWREWLLRAVAGEASKLQIMYGAAGERWLNEVEIGWLPGYEGSAPVRVGNAAVNQFQLDVYGEVLDSLHEARRQGLKEESNDWQLQQQILDFLESHWEEPDEGLWEIRGDRRHFTHSKIMAWVAFDRAVKAVEEFPLDGDVDKWKSVRDEIHREVCREGFDADRNAFTQYYGAKQLDASLLLAPLVGFLPPTDERIKGTITAIEKELSVDGFVMRYSEDREDIDGLPKGEGAFLACSFWLVDCLGLIGREKDARRLFDRLLGIRNDVGLLSEEYDVEHHRLVGNFPQAFSHVALANSAHNLSAAGVRRIRGNSKPPSDGATQGPGEP
ncbi:MAG: glycoside hydrolase family 15 protein [Actinomycetota bacterium]|nr:glycoside hydrolase family 15 protein [Actinomycetota bacterium]